MKWAELTLVSKVAFFLQKAPLKESHGHGHPLFFLLAKGEQLVVPIFERGELSGHGDVPRPQQFAGDSAGGFMSCLIVVQAQGSFLQLWPRLQQMVDGGSAQPAQGHIGVILPPLWVQRNVREKVDGGLESVEVATGALPVKAVFFFAAGERLTKTGAGEGPSGVEMADLALFIPAHKDGIVMAGALVEETLSGEGGHHLRSDVSGLA